MNCNTTHYRANSSSVPGDPTALPSIALLPATLAALILIQLALAPGGRSNASLVAVLYFFWAILLMAVTTALTAVHGRATVANRVASAIVLGSLLSALLVALQWNGTVLPGGWLSAPNSERLYGNLNQPNHLALQLWLGIAALIHLHAGRQLGTATALAALAALVMAALLTGSRALWLYAFGLVVLAGLLHRKSPGQPSLFGGAVAALTLTGIGMTLLPLLAEFSGQSVAAPVGWLKPGSDGIRGGVWWMAARMGIENPLTGIGWGAFSSASYARIEHFQSIAPAALQLVPGEHAHNIFLNLFAELGVLAPLSLLALTGAWLWRSWRREIDPPVAFALALLLLLGLHAQVEYTLWYAFFLGIAAIALSLGDPRQMVMPPIKASVLGLILAAGIGTLLLLRHDYLRLEQAMNWRSEQNETTTKTWEGVVGELIDLRQRSQFGSYVDLAMIGAMSIDRQVLADKLVVCRQGIAFSPAHYAVFKCAALHALAGQETLARRQFGLALAAYPEQAESVARGLTVLGKEFPELQALAEMASTKAAQAAP